MKIVIRLMIHQQKKEFILLAERIQLVVKYLIFFSKLCTYTVFVETIPQCIQHPKEESTCLIDFGPGTRQSLVEECDKVKGTLPRPITAEQTSAFAQIHPAQFWTGLTTDDV